MKLSGHNFNNGVFDSLLDNICKDVELKKTAEQKQNTDVGDFFSTTTAETLNEIHRDELEFVASELSFAAERAKVAVSAEDLAKFASQVQKEGLRGKTMERAAQKYCSNLDRAIAHPQGTTRISANSLIDQLASHKVMPAAHHPDYGSNDSATGKYMGSSKNPNTIWDNDALTRQASIPLGDEKIKESKKKQEEHKLAMKTAQWQELQDQHSDPTQLHKGITNSGTSQTEEVVGQNLKANTMSIFSDNRDFENIPNETVGEAIIAQAELRANKKNASESETRDIQKPMNTRNAIDNLFG